jgi:hypothetical protein
MSIQLRAAIIAAAWLATSAAQTEPVTLTEALA